MPVPRQIPPVPAHFTDRSRELAELEGLAASRAVAGVTLTVIVGGGGIGKTTIASSWLHQVSGRYPDGQLYAALGGFGPGGPLRPGDVLGGFLRALGIVPERVPVRLNEQAALFRSLTARRSVIVMLDDAASAAQVRALLPGPGASLVVVTARRWLSGLAMDGARFLGLGPLDEPAAVELLDRVAGGGRAGVEPEAAREVARLCDGLPLAVSVCGARLARRRQWRVERIARELAGERGRLAALAVSGDVSVTAVIDLSYQALTPAAARLYRLAAWIPGNAFSADLAAASTATGTGETGRLLDTLTDASLLMETGEARFGFHDLVRLHARGRADTDSPGERHGVVARSVGWYLSKAVAADVVVIPGRWRLGPLYARHALSRPAYGAPAEALAWLESELPGLDAAVHAAHDEGLHEQAWQLCEALWGLFTYRKYFRPWIDVHKVGLASAEACGDRRAQARLRVQLGLAYLGLGRYQPAQQQFRRALALDRQEGHRIGEATALEQLGLIELLAGRPGNASRYFTQARDIFQQIGRPRGIAGMTRHIGEAHRDAGRYADAIRELTKARELFAALPDRFNEARALTSLGQTYLRAEQPADAAGPLSEALAIMSDLGSHYERARIHAALGEAAAQTGDRSHADGHFRQALAIYEQLQAPEADALRQRLNPHDAAAETNEIRSSDSGMND